MENNDTVVGNAILCSPLEGDIIRYGEGILPRRPGFDFDSNDNIDQLEAIMQECPPVDCPLEHRFVKGMYIRKIFMPVLPEFEATLVTSLIHMTNHPYFILKGKVSVFSDNDGEQILKAGEYGITRPCTRRVLRIWEDCTWVTCHAIPWLTGEEDSYSDEEKEKIVARIRSEIIEPHTNEYLGGELINNVLTKTIKNED